MKKRKRKNSINIFVGNIFLVFTLFLFLVLFIRLSIIGLADNVDGINLNKFSKSHTIKHENILAKRGTIYDTNGDVLAENVYSYSLIAYLRESRGEGNYVKDKEETAKKLATVINLSEEKILSLLNKTNKDGEPLYQTEFGSAGKGLTELTKDKIEALNLDGIDFIESQKRYYPKGAFLAYTLGYAKLESDGTIKGEMGIEALLNSELTGNDGFREYQKDLNGYKIANTQEVVQDSTDGNSIYLTIDSNVQFFIEQAITEAKNQFTFDELNMIVADAKSGKILGLASSTNFDPNYKNISTYMDPNISTSFEPGSTMKIFTYMAALETGKYDGNKTFKSGSYKAKDGTIIHDSDWDGWGTISYDKGFAFSSNVGIINIINDYLDRNTLMDYYKKLGFGSKTGIELSKEASGSLKFKYETEVYNAGFGQGVMVTCMQNIKALTSVSNDGILLKPYIVDKIVDQNGKVILENSRTELGRVASKQTTDKIKDLMESVVTVGTGSNYNMPEYGLIAKTGTAQISSTNGQGYLTGQYDYIRGFLGMFPKNDPKILIYANVKRPKPNSPKALTYIVKDVVKNISKYYNIYNDTEEKENKLDTLDIDNYYNKDIEEIKNNFNSYNIDPIVIGNGDKIINQYPNKCIKLTKNEKIFLLTNYNEIIIPDFKGWSKKDVLAYLTLANIPYTVSGDGYLVSQSIKDIKYESGNIELVFENKYNEDKVQKE